VNAAVMPPDFGDWNPYATTGPIYMNLTEHHAVSPHHPAPVGFTNDPADDGVNNGWFTDGARFEPTPTGVKVHWGTEKYTSQYERHDPARPNSHSPDTCNICRPRSELDEDEDEEDADDAVSVQPAPPAPAPVANTPVMQQDPEDAPIHRPFLGGGYSDDHDKDVRRPPASCDGVSDVILTGDTEWRHGMAWHFYNFYGRVRPWDGLITIVREAVRALYLMLVS
jgi:hypothetical protein